MWCTYVCLLFTLAQTDTLMDTCVQDIHMIKLVEIVTRRKSSWRQVKLKLPPLETDLTTLFSLA